MEYTSAIFCSLENREKKRKKLDGILIGNRPLLSLIIISNTYNDLKCVRGRFVES